MGNNSLDSIFLKYDYSIDIPNIMNSINFFKMQQFKKS